jgi:anti-sigma B factor antagonist
MQTQIFNAFVHLKPDLALIELQGDINISAEEALLQTCQTAVESGASVIALDFSRVAYINSTGIALIVQLLSKASKDNRRIIGFGLNSHYMEIFKITRLSDFIELYPDETTALKTIGSEQA